MNWLQKMRKSGSPRRIGRGIKKERGTMNKLEREYEERLRYRMLTGDILWYRYEGINLELAKKTFWRPDFFLMNADGEIEVHEVKARWKKHAEPHIEDHAKVRIKVAAEQYPFRFFICYINEQGFWTQKEVNPAHEEEESNDERATPAV